MYLFQIGAGNLTICAFVKKVEFTSGKSCSEKLLFKHKSFLDADLINVKMGINKKNRGKIYFESKKKKSLCA